MRPRLLLLLPCLAALFACAGSAHAADALTASDAGRLVVFSGGEPIATEDFQYETHGDTLYVTSRASRHLRGDDGSIQAWTKTMELLAHADDMDLLHYRSTERFGTRKVTRMVMPSDNGITVTTEKEDGSGAADKLDRLPGRLYVLDAGLFSLFDVIARNLHGRIFNDRPVGLITMGDSTRTLTATASPAGRDTLRWGAKPVLAERIKLSDASSVFTLYASAANGRLLRLENAAADLVVMREPPAAPSAARRRPKPQPPH
jgi:hypothetical protein